MGYPAYVCSVTQSCPTLCNPMDCSPPGSSVHGILQVRILEWVATPSSRGSSQPGDRICISMSPALACGLFTTSTTGGAHVLATVDNAAVNTEVRASFQIRVFSRYVSRSFTVLNCQQPDNSHIFSQKIPRTFIGRTL